MKLLLFGVFLSPLFCYCQFFGGENPGFKTSGIFDTVKAVILIDNKKMHVVQRIEGYAVREWRRWYGGIDPYFDPSYRPCRNQWCETGIFLYKSKRKISTKIWQTENLKSMYQPNEDSIEQIKNSKKKKTIENTDTVCSTKVLRGDLYGGNGITTLVDTTISFGGSILLYKPIHDTVLITEWGRKVDSHKSYSWQSDTAQLILFIDKKPWWKQKVKLRKIKGYRVNTYGDGRIESYHTNFYDLNWKEINPNQICAFDFNNWKGSKL